MAASVMYTLFVGVGIAAATFTAAWGKDPHTTPRPHTFAQTADGFTALQQHLVATAVAPSTTLVMLEATGSYWVALAVALHHAGYQVSVLNPAHVHNYAKSLARRAKTDAGDAQVL